MADSSDALDTFSYASADDPKLKRFVIRIVERLSGQPYLRSLYEDYRNNPVPGESFWDSAVRRLELKLVLDEDRLSQWPKTGPLVVVSNHPFGVLDGVVIAQIVSRVRQDFLVLTNSVLYRAEEIRPFLLPVDFAETEEALQTNLKTRAAAKAHLQKGGCLVVFPAGGVSTTPSVWHKRAIDSEWKTLTGRLISQSKAPVAPVYFAGQNSRLFQLASHVSMTLRLSLLFKEVHDKIGSEIHVRMGEIMPYEKLSTIQDRREFMDHLKGATYALGKGVPNPPKSKVKRPRRAPKKK
ncbi:MAG TPA: lysophospholipid acyltransferase family protein [Rhizomicrobium sp.]|nr:lysophospholipid acyltransferase family protein [Rhizomicrobium sp.]